MLRFVRFTLMIVFLAAVVLAGIWLAGQPGSVTFALPPVLAGDVSSVQMPLLMFTALLLLAVLALYWTVSVLKAVFSFPARLKRGQERRKVAAGLEAVRDTLLAIAGGDTRTAKEAVKRTEKLTASQPEIALLLGAQVAEMSGDHQRAGGYFRQLQAHPKAAFAGTRGLLLQARNDGDTDNAYALAKQAWQQHSDRPGMAETLLHLHLAKRDWQEALDLLPSVQRHGTLGVADLRALKACILLEASRKASGSEALRLATLATETDATAPQAWINRAHILLEQQQADKALPVLLSGWRKTSADSILLALPALYASQAAPSFHRAALKLAKVSGQKPAALYALAMAENAAGMRTAASSRLQNLFEHWPHREIAQWLAQYEQAEGHHEKASYWLSRAAAAPALPQWQCKSCGHLQAQWAYQCDVCHAPQGLSFGHLLQEYGKAVTPVVYS